MATVVKDFKIKSGLVVEGTTGTINGFDILTKSTNSDDYIIDLIGGETLVTSVDADQLQVIGGELSVKSEVFDDFGSADAAQSAAETFATNADTDLYGTLTSDIATAKSEAGVIAQGYADTAESDAISAASADATTKANAAQAAAEATASADATTKANAAQAAAETYADSLAPNYDPSGAAFQALTDANAYTDTAEGREQTNRNNAIANAISDLNLPTTYDAYGSAALAQTAAEEFATQAVADLVNGAPAVLDTLAELATALENNPDIIADLQDVAAGKQDTLTAGANIDITGDTISVTGLDTDDVAEGTNLYFTDARALTATAFAYDVYGSAQNAEDNANAYADGLASNYDAAGSAAAAQAAAEATASADATTKANAAQAAAEATASADATTKANAAQAAAESFATNAIDALDTDAIEEGFLNQYFTDQRAQMSAGVLLTKAETNLTNIQITPNANGGLDIVAENGVADSDTDDLAEGSSNLYFTDVRAVDALQAVVPNFEAVELDSVAKQVASTLSAPTAGIQTGYAFAKEDYRSAEFLVKVAYGTHTEISKVLLTLDTSDNIAITEYGIVGTNGSASSISAGISGTDVQLLVTTTNNNSTVTVMGTLLV